jgi:hypothetical protein
MKRNLGVWAAAALLAGLAATSALAAGQGRGGGLGGGGGLGAGRFEGAEPFLNDMPSTPAPIFNQSSPYTVPQSAETPVSPGSPGSVFGNH